ncbi:acyl-CoA thioesterase II [Bradyrhizobium sp. WSM1743]|uniref:acyl-CoA thioesterase n=1 Tax=Bradyrhizobium sp. WSM1743 TaxID=318996 RepID=UPI00041C19C9|nr:acyl-CoA thioesterase II [Bradyrhizobium sp. WSM1743]
MSKILLDLRAILDLETIERDLFRGKVAGTGARVLFGGQVIGQAMVAACRAAERRLPHSLHCYFIQAGDPQLPILYQVERLRDDNSYSLRRVTALQCDNAIFSAMMSFHVEESAAFEHQDNIPVVHPQEQCIVKEKFGWPTFVETPQFIRRHYGIDLRPVETGRYLGEKVVDGAVHLWIKIAEKLPDDAALHMCALAYASDYSLLDAVTARHGRAPFDRRVMVVSLDHSMWFHRQFRVDDWLLYAHDSPSAQDGRGLTRGLIFRSDGALIASVAQEGSVRERR